jgi:4-amino-4-deoxy-L-arabinose transferase-like glycosyltransferase
VEEARSALLNGAYYWIVLLQGLLILACLALDPDTILQRLNKPSGKTWGLLALIVLAGGYMRLTSPGEPVVYYDEFYYLCAARSMAHTHEPFPEVHTGLPPRAETLRELIPPYPPGWPFLLSFVTGNSPFEAASAFNRILSIISILLMFLVVRRIGGDRTGLLAALLLAFHPVGWKAAGGADACVPTLFFLLLSLAFLLRLEQVRSSRAAAGFGLGLAFLLHMRPENIMYIAALAIPAVSMMGGLKKGVWLWGLAALALFSFPDVVILAGGMIDPFAAANFMSIPRPGFESTFQTFTGNTANNVLFLFENRIHPALLTALFLMGLSVRKSRAFTWKALVLWFALFLLVLAPFPFWDFSLRNTNDGWRFSLHLVFPMMLGASYFMNALIEKRRVLILAALVALVAANPLMFRKFTAHRNPVAPLLDAVKAVRSLAGQSPVGVEDPNVYMACVHYGGLRAFLPSEGLPCDPEGGRVFLLTWKEPRLVSWPDFTYHAIESVGPWRIGELRALK